MKWIIEEDYFDKNDKVELTFICYGDANDDALDTAKKWLTKAFNRIAKKIKAGKIAVVIKTEFCERNRVAKKNIFSGRDCKLYREAGTARSWRKIVVHSYISPFGDIDFADETFKTPIRIEYLSSCSGRLSPAQAALMGDVFVKNTQEVIFKNVEEVAVFFAAADFWLAIKELGEEKNWLNHEEKKSVAQAMNFGFKTLNEYRDFSK